MTRGGTGLDFSCQEEFVQCTELEFEENTGVFQKSGEAWDLLRAQLMQHQRSTAARASGAVCDDGSDMEVR